MNKVTTVILIVLVFSCTEEKEIQTTAKPGTLQVLIDGNVRTSSEITATLTWPDDEQLRIAAKFQIAASTTELGIAAYSNNIYNALEEGEYIIEGIDDGVLDVSCYYAPADITNGAYFSLKMNEAVAGNLQLTEIDRANKLVSGTFNVKLARGNDPKTVTFAEGTFTKISYTE